MRLVLDEKIQHGGHPVGGETNMDGVLFAERMMEDPKNPIHIRIKGEKWTKT